MVWGKRGLKWFLHDRGIVSLEARKRALVSGLLDGMGISVQWIYWLHAESDVCVRVIESLWDDRVGGYDGRLWKYKAKEV